MIGLVPILGGQSMADRYTYIPLIGIFLALSWGLADLSAWSGLPKWAPAALAALSSPGLRRDWLDAGRLLAKQQGALEPRLGSRPGQLCSAPQSRLGTAGRSALDQAAEHLSRAAAADSHGGLSHYALANVLAYQGQTDEAIRYYSAALDINPNWPEAHKKLAALGP